MLLWVSGKKESRTHFFVCDVCDYQTVVEERKNASWDEVRLVPVRLKETGWQLTKTQGRRGSSVSRLLPT